MLNLCVFLRGLLPMFFSGITFSSQIVGNQVLEKSAFWDQNSDVTTDLMVRFLLQQTIQSVKPEASLWACINSVPSL